MAESADSLELIASLRRQQRRSWQSGERAIAEAYLQRHPELQAESEAALELIYNEIVIRQRLGEAPQLKEYQERFPQLAAQLELLFEVDSALETCPLPAASDVAVETHATVPVPCAATDLPPIPGYEIIRELGRGGVGVVYAARHKPLNRTVALKMLLAGGHASLEQRARFRTEAEALARLRHPNIVPIYEVGEHDGRPYLVMEHVNGGSLALRLAGAPWPIRKAVILVETLAEAMQHAHLRGIVHRDLTPANVLLALEGEPFPETEENGSARASFSLERCIPKITDFGLAKLHLGEGAASTQSGMILGTPSYMAPEQADGRSRQISPAADIYALGAILYEMLTGRPPFRAETPLETLLQVQAVEPVPPSRLRPKLPRDLATICLKCLEKEPGRRYPSAAALAEDLRHFLAGKPIAARQVGTLERTWRWCRRNPRWAAMLATVAGLLLIIAVGASGLSVWALREKRDARVQLFESRLAEARAKSLSHRPGQRFESLALLDEARELARELKLSPARFHELRNATIAALLMPDLYPAQTWAGYPAGSRYVDFDDNLEVYARTDEHGNCSIRRVNGDLELHLLPGTGQSGVTCLPVLSRDARFVTVGQPFTKDGQMDGRLSLWKLDGAKPEVLLTETNVYWVDFRPDGQEVAFSHAGGAISLYDLHTGRLLKRLAADALTREVVIALHPTEPLVAVASYFSKVVQVRDLRTEKVVKSLDMQAHGFHVAWHPEGHTLAVSDGGNIRLFDRTTFQHQSTFESAGEGARLFFNHSGDQLAVYGWDVMLRLYDTATGQLLFQVPHTASTHSLRFDRDDRRLAGFREDGRLSIWRVANGGEYRTLVRQALPHKAQYSEAAISPDGRLLAGVLADGVGFWDLSAGTELAFLPLNNPRFVHFEPLPVASPGGDEPLISSSSGGEGRVRESLLIGHETGTYRWPIHYDLAAPGLRRIGPPQPLSLPAGHHFLGQSADGQVLLTCFRAVGEGQPWAGAWILHEDRPESPLHLDAGADVGHIALSPDGRWAVTAAFGGGEVKLWDARTGRLERQLPERASYLHFSPDGRWLASGGAYGGLLAVRTWEKERQLPNPGHFAPDSRMLTLWTDTATLRLVEAASGREFAKLEDPDLDVPNNLLFTPDGTRLVTVNSSKGVHVWDLRLLRQQLAERGLDWDAPPFPRGQALTKALRLQFDCGDFDRLSTAQAVKNFDRAVQAAPGLGVRWFLRGKFHQRAGRYEEALADLRKALELWPGSPSICNHLAWLYITGPDKIRDAREAVALAERAVKLQRGEWGYQNTLGLAYYRAGRIDDAVVALEKSLEGNSPADQTLDLYFLAMCHYRLEDAHKAKEYIDRAVAAHERNGTNRTKEAMEELQRFRSEAETLLAEKPRQ